jgi:glutamate-ammonia-ligase adenylyltransferase
LRLSIDDAFRPEDAPRGLTEMLLRAGDAPDIARLEAQLSDMQKSVRKLFVAFLKE